MKIRALTKVLETQAREGDASLYETGDQRARNHRDYLLKQFNEVKPGESTYISPDVFDVVEAKKSYLSEVFFSGRRVVKFRPVRNDPPKLAAARTAYVNLQLEKNHVGELFRDAWHDALVAKRLAVCAEWLDDTQESILEVTGITPQELQGMLPPDAVALNTDGLQPSQEQPGTYDGVVRVEQDTSRVKLTLIQPERYFRDPDRAYVRESTYAGYWWKPTRIELIVEGYDEEQVMRLRAESTPQAGDEDEARRNSRSGRRSFGGSTKTHPSDTLMVYRNWTMLRLSDYPDVEEALAEVPGYQFDSYELYEVIWCGNEILVKEGRPCIYPAEEIPLFEWTEFKVSHAEEGVCVADVLAHTQRVNSTLKRLIINNQVRRNTSRFEAQFGAIKNPRELLDNNIGGVIWSKRMGSVKPLDAPELSPLSLPVLEMLAQDKEARSGSSRLAKGLNTDVVRYQNAADMVERLTNSANRRDMRACKDFANTFLIPLCKFIYRLGVKNDKGTHSVEIDGQHTVITPGQWLDSDYPMDVSTALTPEEGRDFAQLLLMAHGVMKDDPMLGQLYGIQQRHNLMDDVFEALGANDTGRYMMRPESPEFAQMQKMAAEQAKAMQAKQEQLGMDQINFQKWLLQSSEGRAWEALTLERARLSLDATDKAADNTREDDKLEHQKVYDFAKLGSDRKIALSRKTGA